MIELDYNNLMASKVGRHGLNDNDLDKGRPFVMDAIERLQGERDRGERPYLDLPDQDLTDILKFVEERQGQYDDLLILGIGGSALGTIALRTALCAPHHNSLSKSRRKGALRLHVLDHVDPVWVTRTLKMLKPQRTLVNVISKSGTTAETMSQYLLVREWLESKVDDVRDHFVFTTDPEKGLLRRLSNDHGIPAFSIPDGVGGRFSVFTPVGLLPAAFAGIDIKALLQGAKTMTDRGLLPQLGANPSATMALTHMLLNRERGKSISVWMPYTLSLRDVADWYRQLWAESLGKRYGEGGQEVFAGQTPAKSLGVTDQHSQVQLYVEGPNDKIVTFLSVKRFGTRGRLPEDPTGEGSLAYLGGASLQKLTEAERQGTEIALTRAERPNCHLILPRINEEAVGGLLQMTMIQTSLAGYLLGIDPYDQPGVEYGKIATFARMGREGFTDELEVMKPFLSRKSRYVCR